MLTLLTLLLSIQPIPRVGNTCPPGFYAQSGYCTPSSGYRQEAIDRQGSTCPYGWYRSGDYCTRTPR